ncbi:hypothetical protein LQ318_04925 [Aliifodinibius salicampi]|uniref:Galactosyltransferase C-terminal domain-containing protein n=1 Tax=Fodinibius salicampi TaxID=1920655 RepID=A0ABT3PWL0_9BACT|nr:galactosyltransferase-related protein [Fodinibius salicampi]MCW9712245.1 hypothetical protein [Fodinibius salicampi]
MSEKTSIEDVTFLIPVRVDSIVRLENIMLVTDFLLTHFETSIHLLEATAYNNKVLERLLPSGVNITFVEDHDPVFHRTKYINQLVERSSTPYLAVWDTDVIVSPDQLIQSVNLLRNEEADFVYPYEDKFLDTSSILRELYIKSRDLDLLKEHAGKMKELYSPNPVGGGFLAEREAYIKSGMENEHYYGWGREDGDRLNRWEILDFTVERVPGPLFHLTHDRGENSTFHAEEQKNIKISEIYRIASMSKKELGEEVNSWRG